MFSTLSERLKEAMDGPPKVSGVALANACKITPTSVSDWLSGKSKTMEASNMLAAAKLLNVDPEWLTNGIGPKRSFASWRAAEETPIYANESPAMVEAIKLLREIGPDQLAATISFLKWQLASKAPPQDGQALHMAG